MRLSAEKKRREKSRFLGNFKLQDQEAFGELLIKRDRTLLSLTSHSQLPSLDHVPHLFGITLDHQKITCIDCVGLSQGSGWKEEMETHYYADVFPHFVAVGDEHLDPGASTVNSIHFAVDDLSCLFYDFDAFGRVTNADSIIDTVLAERRRIRPVQTGEWPQVAYFTGKLTIIEVATSIGKVAVTHQPSFNLGGPDGICIRNRMVVSVEPDSAVTFDTAIERMLTVVRFLSVIAGRRQGVHDIHVRTTASQGPDSHTLPVYWSHAPKGEEGKAPYLKPHPGDVPLDSIQRPEEFSVVLRGWIAREDGWRIARVRYLCGLHKGNAYDPDRLIAAANMFDILPPDAVPLPANLPDDLGASQADCIAILKKLPPGQDRDTAIAALKRMGRPSLPKKVQHRTALVEKHFAGRFSELAYVAKLAVQCRNYFVHGPSDDFHFNLVEPFLSFLTDALEFVFAASDLIEAGWDAVQWNSKPHGTGHSFARFRGEYDIALAELKRATGCSPR